MQNQVAYYINLSVKKYHPFGMPMPGRSFNSHDYRFGFNGMEKDDEVSGDGNQYTTEFRQYDPRLGRWTSLDPLMAQFPHLSPYVAFANNPIYYVDPYGLAPNPGGDNVAKPFCEDCNNGDNVSTQSQMEGLLGFDTDDFDFKLTPVADSKDKYDLTLYDKEGNRVGALTNFTVNEKTNKYIFSYTLGQENSGKSITSDALRFWGTSQSSDIPPGTAIVHYEGPFENHSSNSTTILIISSIQLNGGYAKTNMAFVPSDTKVTGVQVKQWLVANITYVNEQIQNNLFNLISSEMPEYGNNPFALKERNEDLYNSYKKKASKMFFEPFLQYGIDESSMRWDIGVGNNF
ncbi:MAG: hypothetical protein H6578_10095 [Chitinophagales bacterium]|nr:hypothetical protein [Chitinophagales bacterium]